MRESLGSLLVKNGVATDGDIKDAIQEGQKTGEPLGKVLVRKGVASESQLGKLLAEQWQLQYLEADDFEVDEVAALRISREDAARMGAAPIAYDGNTIVMAIVEPHAELFAQVSRELGEAAYIVVSRSTFEQLTGGPHARRRELPSSAATMAIRPSRLQRSPKAPMRRTGTRSATKPQSNPSSTSRSSPTTPMSRSRRDRNRPARGCEAANRMDELEQMLDEVLPLLRTQLTEQHEALADAEEKHGRDAEKIRELESKS